MIHATRGVVLNHIKYAESSIIVHIYTELFGRQSYLINQVRSAKNKGKAIFMQPLALLNLQVYHSSKKDVQRIKDFSIHLPFETIPFNQTKRSVAFFITEMMNRSLREEESNAELFQYVIQSIELFDQTIYEQPQNFHLFFLAGLTRYLGFQPHFDPTDMATYFDLQQGISCQAQPVHNHYLTGTTAHLWQHLFDPTHINSSLCAITPTERQKLNEAILEFYMLHLDGFGHLKSLDILKEIHG
jgi:DNA repair protein RecO (recombination protein O)